MGDDERGFAQFAKVLKLNPSHAGVYKERSVQYSSLGNYEQALEDAEKVIQLAGYGNIIRAKVYRALKQYDKVMFEPTSIIDIMR